MKTKNGASGKLRCNPTENND